MTDSDELIAPQRSLCPFTLGPIPEDSFPFLFLQAIVGLCAPWILQDFTFGGRHWGVWVQSGLKYKTWDYIYSGGQGPDPSTLSPEPRSFDLGEHTVPEPVL